MMKHVWPLTLFMVLLMAPFCGEAKSLGEMWQKVIDKYPKPTAEERKSLSTIYEQNFLQGFRKYGALPDGNPKELTMRLKPYRRYIKQAALDFDVPENIIRGVIMMESSGRPDAKAKTSSAKGLMQCIDGTFLMARRALKGQGVTIENPYDPEDAILAGTWYLSYVFELAKQDYPAYRDRKEPEMWSKALEYYYAGPAWGKLSAPVVHTHINGKRLVIEKRKYARNVLQYARIL